MGFSVRSSGLPATPQEERKQKTLTRSLGGFDGRDGRALPLAMAFANSLRVPPQAGLYTARRCAGFLIPH